MTFWRVETEATSHSPAAAMDVTRTGRSTPKTHFLDNRGLEPPQPMIRTLSKLEKISDAETLVIHNDRRPLFLYPVTVMKQKKLRKADTALPSEKN